MWKEHIFYRGSLIKVNDIYYEVENVYNEVSLKSFFNLDWDIDIIPDILLQTTGGYVAIEIFYKHKKNWLELEPYYQTIKDKIIKVFEVDVNIAINENIKWSDKDDMVKTLLRKQQQKEIRQNKQREELAKEEEENRLNELARTPDNNRYECYFNNACKLIKIKEDGFDLKLYAVPCFVLESARGNSYYEIDGRCAILVFDANQNRIMLDRIKRNINLPYEKHRVWYGSFDVIGNINRGAFLYVKDFHEITNTKLSSGFTAWVLSAVEDSKWNINDYQDTFDFSDDSSIDYIRGFYYDYYKNKNHQFFKT